MQESTEHTEREARAEFIAGLRAVADFYEANPDFPLPYQTWSAVATFQIQAPWPDRAAKFAELIRMLGGKRAKDYNDEYANVTRDFGGGVRVEVWAPRDEVCTKTQVGTVKEMRPDPNAPLVEVEVPVYAYECEPVLDAGDFESRPVDYGTPAVDEAAERIETRS